MKILGINKSIENTYLTSTNNNNYGNTIFQKQKTFTNTICFTGSNNPLGKSIFHMEIPHKNKIKIIFADIDGTLSPRNDIISPYTLKTMEYLHKHKIPVILTTARCYKDTLPILKKIKTFADYVITLQGGEIVDKRGLLITKNSIPHEIAYSLNNWYHSLKPEENNLHMIMYIDNQPYSTSNIKFRWKAATSIEQVPTFDKMLAKGQRIQKVILYKPDEKNGSNFSNLIKKSFNLSKIYELDMCNTGTGLYEFQNKGITKDKAIDFILKKLKINPKNVMVIGDSSNDVDMFNYIKENGGFAVAMGNATTDAKIHSTAITSGIDEDGFSKAINVLFGWTKMI